MMAVSLYWGPPGTSTFGLVFGKISANSLQKQSFCLVESPKVFTGFRVFLRVGVYGVISVSCTCMFFSVYKIMFLGCKLEFLGLLGVFVRVLMTFLRVLWHRKFHTPST